MECKVHTVKYYSAIKGNGILTHATAYLNLENIIQSERNWTQNSTYLQFHSYEVPRICKFIVIKSRLVIGNSLRKVDRGVIV